MRVLQVLRVDAGLYYGGGEVQAERTREALVRQGVEVTVHGGLNRELGDIVHFFGLFDSHWEVAKYCLDQGIPYVVSPIFVTPRSQARLKWRSFRQRFIDFKFPKRQFELLKCAREIFPLTGFEQSNLTAFFGDRLPTSTRVPNGVEPRFAAGDPKLFRAKYDIKGDFVLHAATIEKSKNQLGVIQALKGTDIQAIFLGRIHDQAYFERCKEEMGPNMRYLGTIPHDGEMLPSAFKAAKVFCLSSRREILPLSAMEATIAGCQIILGSKWGGQEVWGNHAAYVDPEDPQAIRASIETAMMAPPNPAYAKEFMEKYSWDAVAKQLKDRYSNAIGMPVA
ncbi:MAG: glycosyltransferase family 4 protein [Fimbriimonadaceae bacterium]